MVSQEPGRRVWIPVMAVLLPIAVPVVVDSLIHFRLSLDFLLFTAFVILGDVVELRFPIGSCSVSSAPILSAVLLFSRPFAVLCVVAGSVAEGLMHRKPVLKTIFNTAQLVLAATLSWFVFRLASGGTASLLSARGMLSAFAAWLAYFIVNAGLVAWAVRQVTKATWSSIWRDLLRPTLPVFPTTGVVGITLAIAYRSGPPVTIVLFLGLYFMSYVALVSSLLSVRNRDLSARYEDTQAYLRDLVAGMLNGVVAVDAQGRVTIVNRAAEELLGRRAESVMGREVRELGETSLPALLRQVAASGKGINAREMQLRLPGRTVEAIGSVAVLRDAAGKASGAVAVVQDVTEHKQMERRMAHLDRLALMGEFAAGVVHEINNPLALITMALGGARAGLEAGEMEDVFKDLDLAQRSLSRLEKLSRQLLSFSRPVPAAAKEVDFRESLDEVLNIVAPQARLARVRVTRDVPGGLQLLAESSALQQIFLNLAANAVQAMPEGGELRVSAGRVVARTDDVAAGRVAVIGNGAPAPGGARAVRVLGPLSSAGSGREKRGFVWIRFSDTGVGMSPDDLQRLGRSFFTTKEKGTGLGIAVVCKILAQYRGMMEIWSEVGAGTTFRLWFPELTTGELASLRAYSGALSASGELSAAEEDGEPGLAGAAWERPGEAYAAQSDAAARDGAPAAAAAGWLRGWSGLTPDLPDLPVEDVDAEQRRKK